MSKLLALLFTISISIAAYSQNCALRLSVLTCAPGTELYSTFGHTAIRVIDSASGSDVVFNWGTFDFNDPNFYTKFVSGKLNYFVSAESLAEFIYTYQYEQRSIIEQELLLSCEEKLKLYEAIQTNLLPQNRYYKYDFLKDNCTSRVRDLLIKNAGMKTSGGIVDDKKTFRNQLHEYLDGGGKPWSKLGIDMLLGSKLDKPAGDYNAMFLPDYLLKGIDSSASAGKNILVTKSTLFEASPEDLKTWKYQPLLLLTILAAALVLLTFYARYRFSALLSISYAVILSLTGLVGCLILFMWFGTDYSACGNNLNILWALPTHLIAALFIRRQTNLSRYYFLAATIIHTATLLLWLFLPQQLNVSLIPWVALLAFICWNLHRSHRSRMA